MFAREVKKLQEQQLKPKEQVRGVWVMIGGGDLWQVRGGLLCFFGPACLLACVLRAAWGSWGSADLHTAHQPARCTPALPG